MNGILMLAVGLVAGLVVGQSLKQCSPVLTPTAPPKGANFWDFLSTAATAFGAASKDIFD
jgi:hypothetical protein